MDRRSFFKIGGVVAASGLLGSCGQAAQKIIPYLEAPDEGINPVEGWFYNTACRVCEEGCGIMVRTVEGRAKKVEGNPFHPVNGGGVCARGQASVFQIYHPERIQQPLLRKGAKGSNEFEPISWDKALDLLAEKIAAAKGGGAFAFSASASDVTAAATIGILKNLGSGDFASPTIRGDEVLLDASRNFGADSAIPYHDIAQSEFVLLLGADIFESGYSTVHYSHAFGHMRRGHEAKRGILFYAGPRMSSTAATADHFMGTKPGGLGALALCVAREVLEKAIDHKMLRNIPPATLTRWSRALEKYTMEYATEKSGVVDRDIHHIVENFIKFAPAVAVPGYEITAQTNGVEAARAVEFLNLISREIGRGRNTLLPRRLPQSNPGLHKRMLAFIGAPADVRSGARTSAILDKARSGGMKLGIVNGVDPVHSLPASMKASDALSKVGFLVASSYFLNDTTQYADLVLPDLHFLESWSASVNEFPAGVPVFTLQQPAVNPMYQNMATGDALMAAAEKAGVGIGFKDTQSIVKEMINRFRAEWPEVSPVFSEKQAWEFLLQRGGWWSEAREESLSPEVGTDKLWDIGSGLEISDAKFSGGGDFHLLPYHTVNISDGRTANMPWLLEMPEPITSLMWGAWVEINMKTAKEKGIEEGDILKIESDSGSIELPAYPYPGIAPDCVAVPFGFGHKSFGKYASGRGGNPMDLLGGEKVDGTGAVAWRGLRVKVTNTGKRHKVARDAHPRGEYVGEVFTL